MRPFPEIRVDSRSKRRWRRCSRSVAVMIALANMARAHAAEPAPAPPPFKPPRLVHFEQAVLPTLPAARREAEVVLSIDVDETGKVGTVEVAKPAGGTGARRSIGRPWRRPANLSSSRERPADIQFRCALRIAIGS